MDRRGFDPDADLRAQLPGKWMPVVPWSRPKVSDEYDSNAVIGRRFMLSPLVLMGIVVALALVGLVFLLLV